MNGKVIFAFDPHDTDDIRLEKFTIFLVAGSCCLAGVVWTATYYIVFGLGLVTFLPMSFVVIVGSSLLISHFIHDHRPAIYVQIFCIIYITAFIQWSIGGVFESGFVLAWAFCGPIIALMFFSLKHSMLWLALYLLNILITVVFDDYFSARGHQTSDDIKLLFFVMNLSVSSLVVFVFASYFVSSAVGERQNANRLLLNILPRKFAENLKAHTGVIAEEYDDVSVLFADIVGFTKRTANMEAEQVVEQLNHVFSQFDELAEKSGIEKIKTIGDAYLAVAGLPEPTTDHAATLAAFALELRALSAELAAGYWPELHLRIAIHSGPVAAGVVGKSKFAYDIWGDTVNTASRLEAVCEPGAIVVSKAVRNKLPDGFKIGPARQTRLRDKGDFTIYNLLD